MKAFAFCLLPALCCAILLESASAANPASRLRYMRKSTTAPNLTISTDNSLLRRLDNTVQSQNQAQTLSSQILKSEHETMTRITRSIR